MDRKPIPFAPILLLLSVVTFAGCFGSSASKSPASEEFRREIESVSGGLVRSLAEPMSRGDRGAVRKLLSAEQAKARPGGKARPPQLIVLDRKGVVFECDVPFVCDEPRDYSRLDLVARSLKGKAGGHGKIYAANDKEMYIVLSPIPGEGGKEGLLGLVFDAEAVHRERGVSEKEFLAMAFTP